MSKRKAQDTSDVEDSPTKRVTRSSGALQLVQPAPKSTRSSPLKNARGPPGIRETRFPTPKRTYGRRVTQAADASSHKENQNTDDEASDETEADELNITPRKNKHITVDLPRKQTKHVVFDYVEIEVPKKQRGGGIENNDPRASPMKGRKALVTRTPKPDRKATTIRNRRLANNEWQDHNQHEEMQKDQEVVPESSDETEEGLVQLPKTLPIHFHSYLDAQKCAILDAFSDPPLNVDQDDSEEGNTAANIIAIRQLTDLLRGSIERGEGNSCLIIGPPGSGKSKTFEKALATFKDEKPIVIRLNGHIHRSDRLAMRAIARQVVGQTGNSEFQAFSASDDQDNPFIDDAESDGQAGIIASGALPPPSHLPSLISALPSLSRPVIVLLDAFDLITNHPRQALLYCLLDAVQSCRAGSSVHRGLAVIGLTSRVDVVNMLEKRVKSRFSHRTFRTAGMGSVGSWTTLLSKCLLVGVDDAKRRPIGSHEREWGRIWERSVKEFISDRQLSDNLSHAFGVTKDVRVMLRAMTSAVSCLSPTAPYLSAGNLASHFQSQRSVPRSTLITKLNYPSLCLLIAAQHARTAGHDSFTFEMLRESFYDQVRTSSAAPVMVAGGGIGMVNVSKGILIGAFELLVRMNIFLPAAPATGLSKEFIKHRCAVEREDVKVAIERVGQTNLKKWLLKSQ